MVDEEDDEYGMEDDESASIDMEAVKKRLQKDGDEVAAEYDDEVDSEVYGIEEDDDHEDESDDLR